MASNVTAGLFVMLVMKCLSVLAVVVLFTSSCKKNIESGISVTVSGMFMDTLRNAPVAHVKFQIEEYDKRCFLCRPRPRAIIDSGYTNASGIYTIRFTTTGLGSVYHIKLADEHREDYDAWLDVRINNLKDTVINFSSFRFSVLKHRIVMNEIPHPPLLIRGGRTYADVHNFPADTTVLLKITPARENELYYQYVQQGIRYVRADTVMFAGIQDTFESTVTLDPDTFAPRN